jgi:hypothetical protein
MTDRGTAGLEVIMIALSSSARAIRALACAALFCFPASRSCAKDLETLTRLLVPAYIAQNFMALCVSQDLRFLAEPGEGAASRAAFAEHVKREITIDLPESEAEAVRVTAANTARMAARQGLTTGLGRDSATLPSEPLAGWCHAAAKPFIEDVIRAHYEHHAEFERIVAAAKR